MQVSKITKLLAFVMALMMILALASCGGESKKDSKGTTTAAAAADGADSDGDGIVDDADSAIETTVSADTVVETNANGEAVTNKNGQVVTVKRPANGGSKTTTKKVVTTTKKAGSVVSSSSNPLKADLKGATITVYTPYQNGIFNTKKGLSTYQDACVTRMSTLESKLNCKIKVVVKSVEDISKLCYTSVSSGTKFADIIETPIYQVSTYLSQSTGVDLNTVQNLDLTKTYLNAGNAVSASTFFGKTYFVTSEDMIAKSAMGYFYNKRILKENGLEDPYKLVTSGKWTISKLRSMAKKATKDLDGKSGMSKNDQWGIIQTSYTADASAAILSVNGCEMIKKDSKAGAKYNTDATNVINAISLCTKTFVTDGDSYSQTSGDTDLHNMFMTGKGLFLGAGVDIAGKIMDMDDDFGFVPFPKGDSAAKLTLGTNWNSSVLMIPKNPKSTDYSAAGAFLQAFTYLSQNTTTALYKEYANRYYRDDQSYDMLKISTQSQNITTSSILGSTGDWGIHEGTYKILYNCVPGDKSVKSEIETYKPFSVANLEDLMAKVKKAK